MELKPDLGEAHYNLGVTLQEVGRLDEAEASYTQTIALKPYNAEADKNLLECLYLLGDSHRCLINLIIWQLKVK